MISPRYAPMKSINCYISLSLRYCDDAQATLYSEALPGGAAIVCMRGLRQDFDSANE